ncbi:mobile mystery protein A [Breoghania sp. L-A4]|uniref:mobile mystery protein A n=1 Tax=Breoghania sp. L-A4 TaxID=2304600 RepID=UPI000E35AF6D|nr:mobile mystery protein A [Breoghania sp. L-A4]AXS41899.1 mobile mystery protein A [Breoghania sp. L-A4]
MDTSVKQAAARQYARMLDRAARQTAQLSPPREGWIAAFRKALRMSGPQLARRAGVTKAAVYQAERNEPDGAITLNQMRKMAEALGGRFVYAIVPETTVDDLVTRQAHDKAKALLRRAHVHMALEDQALPPEHASGEIERIAAQMTDRHPADFWDRD